MPENVALTTDGQSLKGAGYVALFFFHVFFFFFSRVQTLYGMTFSFAFLCSFLLFHQENRIKWHLLQYVNS